MEARKHVHLPDPEEEARQARMEEVERAIGELRRDMDRLLASARERVAAKQTRMPAREPARMPTCMD